MPEPGTTPDHLCRAWDLLAAGRPEAAAAGLDPVLLETVRCLHALDRAPAPAPALRSQIWEGLMATLPAAPARPTVPAAHRLPLPADANGRFPDIPLPHPPAASPRPYRPPVAELATAAIILLSLLSGLAVHRLGGDRPPPPPSAVALAPGPVGRTAPGLASVLVAPEPGDAVPSPEECRVPPRSLTSVRSLNGQAAAPGAPRFDLTPVPLPAGEPADPAAVDGVNTTLREWLACSLAGDALRGAALETDAYLLAALSTYGPLAEEELAALTTPQPLEGETAFHPVPAEQTRQLPDGRIAAAVTPPSDQPGGIYPGYALVFARSGDRYLIDGEIYLAVAASPPAGLATPPAARPAASPAAPETGGLAVTASDRSGATITSVPGACYIVVGPVELPPICDNAPEPASDGRRDTDPTPGIVRIVDLPAGLYRVHQRRAPAGYLHGPNLDAAVTDGGLRPVAVTSQLAARLRVIGDDVPLYEEIPAADSPVLETYDRDAVLTARGHRITQGGTDWWPVLGSTDGIAGYVRANAVVPAAVSSPPASPLPALHRP